MGSLYNYSILKGDFQLIKEQKLHKIFDEIADKFPNEEALYFEDGEYAITYTYKNLKQITNQLSLIIKDIIRNKNSNIIGVYIEPSDYLIITLLSILKANAAYLPISSNFPEHRIKHILNDSKPALIIYSEEKSDAFENTLSISLKELFEKVKNKNYESNETFFEIEKDENELAIILYTSGSTGTPKGVKLNHATIMNRLNWQWEEFPYSPTEKRCAFKTALTFVDSVSEIWSPLLCGLTLVIVPKHITANPEKLIPLIEKHKIERLILVPSLLRSILLYLKFSKIYKINLKIWVCSGETLTVQLVDEFFDHFQNNQQKLLNFYGSTEVMGDVTYFTITHPNDLNGFDKVPIGRPVYNTVIYLLDEELKPCQIGKIGEIFVSGLNLASGYMDELKNSEKFIENPFNIDPNYSKMFKTGDFAKIVKNQLVFEGRVDSQIKVRGHRVDLNEIDKCLSKLSYVDKSIVLCYKSGEIEQTIVGFVTLKSCSGSITPHIILNDLKDYLINYMMPQIKIIDSFPLLVNGKIDRQQLLKMYENENLNIFNSNNNFIDYNSLEIFEDNQKINAGQILFKEVEELLKKSGNSLIQTDLKINLQTNFYKIGGNSLNTVSTVMKLREFGYYISINEFIESKNFKEILDKIDYNGTLSNGFELSDEQNDNKYYYEILKEYHKNQLFEIISTSFYEKADLEQWIIPPLELNDYIDLLEKIWPSLLEAQLSFVVYNSSNEVVAASLNFDCYDEPEVDVQSRLLIIFDFLEFLESQARDKLPKDKGVIMHSFMMGTKQTLDPKENIQLIKFMEEVAIDVAKKNNFAFLFTTNTNALTQQLGTNIFNYKTLIDYQVNQYKTENGYRPFGNAPDNQKAIVCYKQIK